MRGYAEETNRLAGMMCEDAQWTLLGRQVYTFIVNLIHIRYIVDFSLRKVTFLWDKETCHSPKTHRIKSHSFYVSVQSIDSKIVTLKHGIEGI